MPSQGRGAWVVVGLAVCLLAGIATRSEPLGGFVGRVLRPGEALLSSVGGAAGRAWQTVTHGGSLASENARLRAELERAQARGAQLDELAQENRRLSELLALGRTSGDRSVAARVIARSPSPWFQTLTLNVGTRRGATAGCAVLAPGGMLGQVFHAGPASCQVLCLTDRLGSVGARLQPPRARQVVGVARGDGNGLCHLAYGDPQADVRPGDAVVTSGLANGSAFPAGLLVGRVVSLERRPHDSSLVAAIRPAAEADRAEEVVVLAGATP